MKKDFLTTSQGTLLPESLQNVTLNELINGPDVEISKKKNVLTIRSQTNTDIVNVEIRHYDDLCEVTKSHSFNDKKVKDKVATIKQMHADGYTQAEIAKRLGTSQPYISKLLND